jgi:Tol biopolymer transport system component
MTDISPAWSPDGRFIAFLRFDEGKKTSVVILIPQRGGSERQLASWDLSKVSDFPRPPLLAWTPDSTCLAFPYTDGDKKRPGLLLISVDTGEKHSLTTAPVDAQWDTAPAFSPDGRTLVFARSVGDSSDLYCCG